MASFGFDKLDGYIKNAFFDSVNKDSELFCAIDTSGVVALPRLEKRIQKLTSQRTKAGVNRFQYKRRRAYKLVGVIAAVLILITLSINVVATFYGMSGIDFIISNIDRFRNMRVGEVFESDGITLIKNGDTYKYRTIEEAVETGQLEVMYPTLLPEGITITRIELIFTGIDEQYLITFNTNSRNVLMSARNHNITDQNHYANYEAYETNDLIFYILEMESCYIANCQVDNLEYYVQCDNKEDLLLIIDNMKKVS